MATVITMLAVARAMTRDQKLSRSSMARQPVLSARRPRSARYTGILAARLTATMSITAPMTILIV